MPTIEVEFSATGGDAACAALSTIARACLGAIIRTMPEAERRALQVEIDAGNVAAVTTIFERAGMGESARATAVDFIEARAASKANPVECEAAGSAQ